MYPLPYWWNFTVSGPVLPNFYWNVKSQEERIKKICEDLWKLIQLYKLVVDAINDHERRIQYLEAKVVELEQRINELFELYNALVARVNVIEGRVDVVEQNIVDINNRITQINTRIDNLINDLPTIVKNIILTDTEVRNAITNLVNSIVDPKLAKKMDKVVDETTTPPTAATTDDVATFGLGGQVKDSNVPISTVIVKNSSATENHIPTYDSTGGFQDSGKTLSDYQEKVTSGVENDVATFDAHGQVKDSGLPVNNVMLKAVPASGSGYILNVDAQGQAIVNSFNASIRGDNTSGSISSADSNINNNNVPTNASIMKHLIRREKNGVQNANDLDSAVNANSWNGANFLSALVTTQSIQDTLISIPNLDGTSSSYKVRQIFCGIAKKNTTYNLSQEDCPIQFAFITSAKTASYNSQNLYDDKNYIALRVFANNSWSNWSIITHHYERVAPTMTNAEAYAQTLSSVRPGSMIYIPEETT